MNIQKAKQQIKDTAVVYFAKDQSGRYKLPFSKQRPLCLMGPPGIGKTAIVEQVAQELGIGFVSYSMTHHTRQSALGLPCVKTERYGDREFAITEYTLSEIIAAVYRQMERTGLREGILFLDEINCVSETLTPAMLQFLQYKTFGMHTVPEGWMVVTAGNPPEYNRSVHPFDIVTWDRLKRIDIQPDFDAWRVYALGTAVHPAILTYLEVKDGDFYHIEATTEGKRFVTARSWDDLSRILLLYEEYQLEVDEDLVGQYLQEPRIMQEFTTYYRLWLKYKADYQVGAILEGRADNAIRSRAKAARFDERLSLLHLTMEVLDRDIGAVLHGEKDVIELREQLKIAADQEGARARYLSRVDNLKSQVEETKERIHNLFVFCQDVFGDGQELLLLVANLTANENATAFISHYGCDDYFAHHQKLQFYEHQKQIIDQLERGESAQQG